MLDIVERLSSTLLVRFRRLLIGLAIFLVLIHATAFALGLLPSDEPAGWLVHLVSYSQSLLGFTGALLLLVLLSDTVRSLQEADEKRKRRVHAFIRDKLEKWFEDAGSPRGRISELIDDKSFTHFKVSGDPALLGGGERARELCSKVHFELTFYPTKLIYGLHFEFPDPSVNRYLAELLREKLDMGEESGFKIDRLVPKKPGWVFLIRTASLTGSFEADFPKVMTHARHFVELVGHTYELVYSRAVLEEYESLNAENLPASA